MTTTWSDFESAEPIFSATCKQRFLSHRHHILGTIRKSGAPRLSGTEVMFTNNQLSIGVMANSNKLIDIAADPRIELHSAPLDENLLYGDAKIGATLEFQNTISEPAGSVFVCDIRVVTYVLVQDEQLIVTTWKPNTGMSEVRRS